MTSQEWTELMLMMLGSPKRKKVSDLPDEPDRDTIYTLEQEWVYLNGEWVRMG